MDPKAVEISLRIPGASLTGRYGSILPRARKTVSIRHVIPLSVSGEVLTKAEKQRAPLIGGSRVIEHGTDVNTLLGGLTTCHGRQPPYMHIPRTSGKIGS
jgi:hypothetical protein